MKRIVTLVACATVCAALVPAGAQTIIDFDTLPDGTSIANNTTISTQYMSVGVVFSQIEDGSPVQPPLASNDFIGGAGSGNGLFNVQGAIFPITAANRADDLRITFLAPVSNVSFITNGFNDLTQFQAFDFGGTLLETITNPTGNLFAVAFTSSGIARIDALQADDTLSYRIDNLTFQSSAVPEPSAFAYLGCAVLAGAAFVTRRKQTAG